MKKRIDRIQYAVEVLAHSDNRNTCYFCKYSSKNYIELTTEFLSYCSDKCKVCIHYGMYKSEKVKIPDYIRNEFKPLYGWELEE